MNNISSSQKSTILFVILGSFIVANALVAEFIGVKIFSLEASIGVQPLSWQLFGQQGTLQFTAGVLLWPAVFVMTDIINEYFGRRGVRFLSYLTVALISYAFGAIFLAIHLSPADWWLTSNTAKGVPDMQQAFASVFGQGLLIIIGSIVAFLIGQLLDVFVFHKIKQATGERWVWLRATGSTLVSQCIDSFVVLYIAFVGGPSLLGNSTPWALEQFFAIGIINYIYKVLIALLLTPFIYFAHYLIDAYLGNDLAKAMKQQAMA